MTRLITWRTRLLDVFRSIAHARRKSKLIGTLAVTTMVLVLWSPSYQTVDISLAADATSLVLPFTYLVVFMKLEEKGLDRSPTINNKSSDQTLWREYKTLDQSVSRRENSLLIGGSIFVTASLVLLGQTAATTQTVQNGLLQQQELRTVIVFGSWLMYSLWLFFLQFTAGRLTDASYRRIKGIEKQLGLEIHRYLVKWRDPIRKWFWLWVLDGLLIVGFLVLGLDIWLFKFNLPVQVAGVVLYGLIAFCPECGKVLAIRPSKEAPVHCPRCDVELTGS